MNSPAVSRPPHTAEDALAALEALADPSRALHSARFFKTGPGEYGEGDVFWGITVPRTREVARAYRDLSHDEIAVLLSHPVHEVRVCGVVILTEQFKRLKATPDRVTAFDFYVRAVRAGQVNNWDLIDISAPTFGTLLVDSRIEPVPLIEPVEIPRIEPVEIPLIEPVEILTQLAVADSMWERRLAVLLTFAFIRVGQFELTLMLADMLLADRQDLMHKAVGWMLREVGKRNPDVLRAFLEDNLRAMPRTTLRYAIEKFPEAERRRWLTR